MAVKCRADLRLLEATWIGRFGRFCSCRVGACQPFDLRAFMSEIDTSWSTVIEPAQVAATVLWGIRENLPYIVTAPGARDMVADHHAVIAHAHDRARDHDPTLP